MNENFPDLSLNNKVSWLLAEGIGISGFRVHFIDFFKEETLVKTLAKYF